MKRVSRFTSAFVLTSSLTIVPPLATQGLPHSVTNGWADLRNDMVLDATEAEEVHGRRLLIAAAEKHGYAAWQKHRTFEVIATDSWAQPSPWWPKQAQRLRLEQLLGTFTSRAVLFDGTTEDGASAIGIQSWAPYVIHDGEPTFLREPNGTASFYLPTLHYFNELPFRLLSAPITIAAGEATFDGKVYDRVFVTWGDGEPSGEYDQYVLWIERESGLVAKAHYTVRESELHAPPEQKQMMRAGAVGTIHFEDHREVAGVVFPFRHVVTLFGPEQAQLPLADHYFHKLEVESARFDRISAADLQPNPRLPPAGDYKVP